MLVSLLVLFSLINYHMSVIIMIFGIQDSEYVHGEHEALEVQYTFHDE